MVGKRVFLSICLIAGSVFFVKPASAENYPLILRGKVVMPDGSPPPFTAGLERICSDESGSKPGPLTNKKGEYVWRMDVDPMRTRSCFIRATKAGYVSSSIDISALNGYLDTSIDLEPIVLTSETADPYVIIIRGSRVPTRAMSETNKALEAMDAGDYSEARLQFQAAVKEAPNFARGWHALGVLSEYQNMNAEARKAYEQAIKCDSKLLQAYMTLVRLCIKTKDWECATKSADDLIKKDKKRDYRAAYLHRAVALYELKDLDKAENSAREAVHLDTYHETPRAIYVLGRILEAKGDLDGAREHMSKYLEVDKKTPDADLIRLHMQNLGKPEAEEVVPQLEYL
jgi:Flp pilus assembly protein TadD